MLACGALENPALSEDFKLENYKSTVLGIHVKQNLSASQFQPLGSLQCLVRERQRTKRRQPVHS